MLVILVLTTGVALLLFACVMDRSVLTARANRLQETLEWDRQAFIDVNEERKRRNREAARLMASARDEAREQCEHLRQRIAELETTLAAQADSRLPTPDSRLPAAKRKPRRPKKSK
jgi:siderophore synthetase component